MSTYTRSVDEAAPTADFGALLDEMSALLSMEPADADWAVAGADRVRLADRVGQLNAAAAAETGHAFYLQQLLLSRIYRLSTEIPSMPTAEGSVVVHEVTRLLEDATLAAQDQWIQPGALESAPEEPAAYVSWLKRLAREHRVFKHPYYVEFIRTRATREDIRRYVIQESVIDGRFDDLLAMMQVGTSGPAKLEIAANFWDEMGNGDAEQVHTHLFNRIYEVFNIGPEDLQRELTANALLSGNLAVLVCRYRRLYPEAVGFLGMTEWLVPDRFVNVVHAWERLGLPDAGILYHRLHVTIDSRHAAGWFHRVVRPAAAEERMRRGIARGTLWRLDSSTRYLDERLGEIAARRPADGPAPTVTSG
jgi:pyrroloquinoline quinone (PQQ) biosynthesis protein C